MSGFESLLSKLATVRKLAPAAVAVQSQHLTQRFEDAMMQADAIAAHSKLYGESPQLGASEDEMILGDQHVNITQQAPQKKSILPALVTAAGLSVLGGGVAGGAYLVAEALKSQKPETVHTETLTEEFIGIGLE